MIQTGPEGAVGSSVGPAGPVKVVHARAPFGDRAFRRLDRAPGIDRGTCRDIGASRTEGINDRTSRSFRRAVRKNRGAGGPGFRTDRVHEEWTCGNRLRAEGFGLRADGLQRRRTCRRNDRKPGLDRRRLLLVAQRAVLSLGRLDPRPDLVPMHPPEEEDASQNRQPPHLAHRPPNHGSTFRYKRSKPSGTKQDR